MIVSGVAYARTGWTEDFATALARSKTSGRPVLVYFTGSDWCPYCVRLDKEVLDQPVFMQWAKEHLILLELDFPHDTPQSPKLKAQNEELAAEFQIEGYPSLYIMDGRTTKVRQLVGFEGKSPEAVVRSLTRMLSEEPATR